MQKTRVVANVSFTLKSKSFPTRLAYHGLHRTCLYCHHRSRVSNMCSLECEWSKGKKWHGKCVSCRWRSKDVLVLSFPFCCKIFLWKVSFLLPLVPSHLFHRATFHSLSLSFSFSTLFDGRRRHDEHSPDWLVYHAFTSLTINLYICLEVPLAYF